MMKRPSKKIDLKVVILSSRGGQGLIHGSHAVREALENAGGGFRCEVRIIDFFAECGTVGGPLTSLYNSLIRRSLRASSVYIKLLHLVRADRWRFFYLTAVKPFRKMLERERPDLVVLTSQYIVSFVGYCRRKRILDVPVYVANIDPGTSCVPLWFNRHMDGHVIPTPEAMVAYLSRGFDREKALPAKLAVRSRFLDAARMDRTSARRKLGLPPAEFYALCAGSREGYGGMIPVVRRLAMIPGMHCIVMCGENAGLHRRIEDLRDRHGLAVTPLGWTDDVHLYMRAADVIVSKPGKQTVKESIAAGTPLIALAYPAVMEQEKGNIEIMMNRKTGFTARSLDEITARVIALKESASLRGELAARIRSAKAGISPGAVARAILEHYNARNFRSRK